MLRLRPIEVRAPQTVGDALEALGRGERALAGGTDLLPRLKHDLERPPALVSLHRLTELRAVTLDPGGRELRIGSGVTLAALASDERVRSLFPSLAAAAASVASPPIRRAATLGGNLHVDPRCRYVNQTEAWRGALGGCLKAGGSECHVVPGGRNCVAAMSSDTVPALVSLEAKIVVRGPAGERVAPLERYYRADGIEPFDLGAGELVTEVRVPLPEGERRYAYVKWRPRGSIDFPLVSLAIRLDLASDHSIRSSRLVAGALGTRPRLVAVPELAGRPLDREAARIFGQACHAQCKPLGNLPWDPDHRRTLYGVLARRAVEALLGERSSEGEGR